MFVGAYSGVTGFTSSKEIKAVVYPVLDILLRNKRHLVQCGVLASKKSLAGIPTKYPHRYPAHGDIGKIFQSIPGTLNLIHYHTNREDLRPHEIEEVIDLGGQYCHGVQLNIAWPDPETLFSLQLRSKVTIVVLQIGTHAFEMVDNSPEHLVRRVAEYKNLADYVLLDRSGGHGKILDPERMRDYLRALTEANLGMGLGVAGGLNHESVPVIVPLLSEFSDLSHDGEGGFRDANDHLVTDRAVMYLKKSFALAEANSK